MDVWASRAMVDIEAIHAVVKPYAEEIGPPEVSREECGMLVFCSGERPPAIDEGNEKKWVIYL